MYLLRLHNHPEKPHGMASIQKEKALSKDLTDKIRECILTNHIYLIPTVVVNVVQSPLVTTVKSHRKQSVAKTNNDVPTVSKPSENKLTILEIVDGYMYNGKKMRKTTDTPVRVSVYDLIEAVTGQTKNASYEIFRRLKDEHPEVHTICVYFKFPGARQQDIPNQYENETDGFMVYFKHSFYIKP